MPASWDASSGVARGGVMSVQTVCVSWHWRSYAYARTAPERPRRTTRTSATDSAGSWPMTQMTQDDAGPAVCVMVVAAGGSRVFGPHDAHDAASSLLGNEWRVCLWSVGWSLRREEGAASRRDLWAARGPNSKRSTRAVAPVVLLLLVRAPGQNACCCSGGAGPAGRVISR